MNGNPYLWNPYKLLPPETTPVLAGGSPQTRDWKREDDIRRLRLVRPCSVSSGLRELATPGSEFAVHPLSHYSQMFLCTALVDERAVPGGAFVVSHYQIETCFEYALEGDPVCP